MFVKVCGLKTYDQIEYAAKLKYSMIGVVLHEKSKRYVNPEEAVKLAEFAKKAGILSAVVGIKYSEVIDVGKYFNYIQIYEAADTRFPTIFATSEKPSAGMKYDYLMYDISKGTGKYEHFKSWIREYSDKIILAGGLDPDNIVSVINQYRPFGVDVSSGVEDTPGVKSFSKMKHFISQIHNAQSITHQQQ